MPSPHVGAPGGRPPSAKVIGYLPEPRVDAAAAVESALRIGLVEVEHHPGVLDALVLVQRMLELRVHPEVGVEHQVLADHAAGVGQPVRKARRRGVEQQPRRLRPVRAEHDRLGALQLQPLLRVEVGDAGRAAVASDLDARHVAVRPDLAAAGGFRQRQHRRPSTSTSRGTRT